MAGSLNVQLRLLASGDILFTGSFPPETLLSEIEDRDLGACHDKRFAKLSIVSVAGQALPTEGLDEWEVQFCMEADAGANAAEMSASDIETCRQRCVEEGFGGFAVWRERAFFRHAMAQDLASRAVHHGEVTLHLRYTARDMFLRRSLAESRPEGGDDGTLELGVLRVPLRARPRLDLAEVAQLPASMPQIRDLSVTVGADVGLECLVEKFPSLQSLDVVIPEDAKATATGSYWEPIQHLASLERLFLVRPDAEVDKGQNAAEMSANDLDACQQRCVEEGFGGFAVWHNKAYFRHAGAADLATRIVPKEDVTLYLRYTVRDLIPQD